MKTNKLFLFTIIIFIIINITFSQQQQPIYTINDLSWENFQPIYTSNIDYVLTIDYSKNVKLSKDGGLNWSNVLDNNNNIIKGINIYKQNENIIVLYYSKNSTIFSISNDGGSTWKSSQTPLPYVINSIEPHKSINGLIVANSKQYILTSQDYGQTWRNVSEVSNCFLKNINRGYFYPTWYPSSVNETIFYAFLENGTKLGSLSVSNDLGNTFKNIIFHGSVAAIYSTENYFYVMVLSNQYDLYTKAKSSPVDEDFFLCEFQFDVSTMNKIILDDSSGAIIMGVISDSDTKSGTVYVSNGIGNYFTLSLSNVYLSNGRFDFITINGIPGTYLFNGIANKNQNNVPSLLKTFITHDNGDRWSRLSPPTGMDDECTGINCKLNLFFHPMLGTGMYLRSIAEAPGLILANGNSNSALSSNSPLSTIKTVFSNDNGQSWKVFSNSSTIYEFGSYGSTIIFTLTRHFQNTIYYTFDQGQTIQSFSFDNSTSPVSSFVIYNIITTPTFENSKFILFAQDSNDKQYLIGIDLTPVLPSVCTDQQLISFTSSCFLGQNMTYNTVKNGENCYLDQPSVESITPCQCTVNDYECDYGFSKIGDSSSDSSGSSSNEDSLTCVPYYSPIFTPKTSENCEIGEWYLQTKGYRKITGSKCIGGVSEEYEPRWTRCSRISPAYLIPSNCNFTILNETFDLSPLISQNYSGYSFFDKKSGDQYYFNLCSPNERCSDLLGSSIQVCQQSGQNDIIIAYADNGEYTYKFQDTKTINSSIQLIYDSGISATCNGNKKTASFEMICNSNTTFNVYNFHFKNCVFYFQIETKYVCNKNSNSDSSTSDENNSSSYSENSSSSGSNSGSGSENNGSGGSENNNSSENSHENGSNDGSSSHDESSSSTHHENSSNSSHENDSSSHENGSNSNHEGSNSSHHDSSHGNNNSSHENGSNSNHEGSSSTHHENSSNSSHENNSSNNENGSNSSHENNSSSNENGSTSHEGSSSTHHENSSGHENGSTSHEGGSSRNHHESGSNSSHHENSNSQSSKSESISGNSNSNSDSDISNSNGQNNITSGSIGSENNNNNNNNNQNKKGNGKTAAIIIIVILGVGIGAFAFILYKKPELKRRLLLKIGIGEGNKYSIVGIVPNSLIQNENINESYL